MLRLREIKAPIDRFRADEWGGNRGGGRMHIYTRTARASKRKRRKTKRRELV